ncbi:MAG TPA: CRISPR-associated protein Csx19 [Pyrinomonadaceae bacterium]|nr:CRISPR-associated protein Csx19 [Pyrinomonadaceae bacterium]
MENGKPNVKQLENLSAVWQNFADNFFEEKTFVLFYASNHCFFGLIDKDGNIEVEDNENKLDIKKVFEARIFNGKAELRWLKGFGEKIISDADFSDCETFDQKYLLWGKKLENANTPKGWTQFATARIGTYFVPIEVSGKDYAQITAREYLKTYKDGNVGVCDERLMGIEAYQPEKQGEK